MGAADYITKPFDLDELVLKVRQLSLATRGLRRRRGLGHAAGHLGRDAEDRGHAAAAGRACAARAHHGRIRRGQGACRAAAALPGLPRRRAALRRGELRRDHRDPDGGRAVRLREGRIHRRAANAQGRVRAGRTAARCFSTRSATCPWRMQVKLLRAIQERRIVRVGGETSIPVDVRIICATNQDLRARVEAGTFREDLYYRINVIHLRIPLLRERREDILWFARQFLREFGEAAWRRHGAPCRPRPSRPSSTTPGRAILRELRHCIERACILSGETTLEPSALFESWPENAIEQAHAAGTLEQYIRDCERGYIQQALRALPGPDRQHRCLPRHQSQEPVGKDEAAADPGQGPGRRGGLIRICTGGSKHGLVRSIRSRPCAELRRPLSGRARRQRRARAVRQRSRLDGRRCAPTALRCSVSWPRRRTHCVRCAHCVQTAATSQKTMRAARAATSPVLLGASQARRSLPGRAFAEPVVVFAPQATTGGCRGRRCPLGAISGATRSAAPGSARASALRELTCRGCLNAATAGSAVSSAARPWCEHRSAVGAQRRPPQHEPPAGSACRDARRRHESQTPANGSSGPRTAGRSRDFLSL